LEESAKYASHLGLEVHAGHGLTVNSVKYVRKIPEIKELNIGHAIISDSITFGLAGAVERMKKEINVGRG
jgi:pyridoxine 5-phosphate synthase